MMRTTQMTSVITQDTQNLVKKQWGSHPECYDADFVERATQRLSWIFGRYFKMDVQGFENVPDEASLLVSNHSGGMLILDVLGQIVAWQKQFGVDRPMHVLFHDILLAFRLTGKPLSRLGGLRASHENSERALVEYQRDVLVYPGGDVEAYRPYKDRYQVNFSGRKGYARLALKTGVPITPIAHSGAHQTLMVLSSGQRIAKFLRLDKLVRSKIFPIYLCFPWILSPGPFLPHLPLPRTFRYRLGEPIEMPQKTWVGDPPEEIVTMVDAKVRQSIQEMLDQLQVIDEQASWLAPWISTPKQLKPRPTGQTF